MSELGGAGIVTTERDRQSAAPGARQWHIVDEHGDSMWCSAPTEDGALRVLNAERPGVSLAGIAPVISELETEI